jgi:hypothetical protein
MVAHSRTTIIRGGSSRRCHGSPGLNVMPPAKTVQTAPAPRSFAAMRNGGFRAQFSTYVIAMMADNIEHIISYWVLFQKFHSPALAGFEPDGALCRRAHRPRRRRGAPAVARPRARHFAQYAVLSAARAVAGESALRSKIPRRRLGTAAGGAGARRHRADGTRYRGASGHHRDDAFSRCIVILCRQCL